MTNKKNKNQSEKATELWKDPEVRAKRQAAMAKGALSRWADPAKKAELLARRQVVLTANAAARLVRQRAAFIQAGIPPGARDSGSAGFHGVVLRRRDAALFDQIAAEIGAASFHRYDIPFAVGWALQQNRYPDIFNAKAAGCRWYWSKYKPSK